MNKNIRVFILSVLLIGWVGIVSGTLLASFFYDQWIVKRYAHKGYWVTHGWANPLENSETKWKYETSGIFILIITFILFPKDFYPQEIK